MSEVAKFEQEKELTRGFTALLGMLLLVLIAVPMLPDLERGPFAVTRFRVLLSGVVIAGVYAIHHSHRNTFVGVALAVPALVLGLSAELTDNAVAVGAYFLVTAAFLIFTAGAILETVLLQHRVTRSTIEGGICVYFLLGIGFVLIFGMLEFLHPGSFLKDGVPFEEDFLSKTPGSPFPELIYFSFVTITTLGYGDIHPATEPAQAVSVGEAILGQLYITIFIARLVGLHIHHLARTDRG